LLAAEHTNHHGLSDSLAALNAIFSKEFLLESIGWNLTISRE